MGRATPPRETGGAARIAMLGTVAAAAITGLATVAAVLVPRLFDGDEQRSPKGSPAATVVSRTPEPPAPLTIAVRQSEDYCGFGWLFPKNPSQLEKPPAVENIDWIAWAQRGGGVRVNQHQVTLTVQGVNEARVVIDRIRVVTLEPRRPPLRGTWATVVCGDPVEYRYLEANLDRNPPTMTSKTTGTLTGEHDTRLDPARFPYQVALNEAESFLVSAVVSKYDIDWRVEVDWSSQGRTGTFVVDNNGQPFHTTSSTAAETTCYWGENGTLTSEPSTGCPG